MYQETDKTLIYAVIDVECKKGLKVAFDDDLTAGYDEFLIGIVADEFDMKSSYIYSDVLNKFRQHH